MREEKVKEWKHWLDTFIAINVIDAYVRGVTIKKYVSRFNGSSLSHQLKVIYSAYVTIIGEEPDYYAKCNIIDTIISKRYKELKETSIFLDEDTYRSPDISFENILRYKHNVEIITHEIELLNVEYKKLKKKHDNGLL